MTEKEIQLLGFERNDDNGVMCEDENGKCWTEDAFYYYTYTVARGLEFISNSNDEVEDEGEWYVEFFDTHPAVQFTKFEEVQSLINLIEKRTVK